MKTTTHILLTTVVSLFIFLIAFFAIGNTLRYDSLSTIFETNEDRYCEKHQTLRINLFPSKITNKEFKNLLKSSPVSVFIKSKEEFKKGYIIKKHKKINPKNYKHVAGKFVIKSKIKGYPGPFIYVQKNRSIESKFITLFHELGHYQCYKDNCVCLYERDIKIMEKHAISYVLKESLKTKNIRYIVNSMLEIEGYVKLGGSDPSFRPYYEASEEIKETQTWVDAVNFLINYDSLIPAK